MVSVSAKIRVRARVRDRVRVPTYTDCNNSFKFAWCLRSDLTFTRGCSECRSFMALARAEAIAALKLSACFHFVWVPDTER